MRFELKAELGETPGSGATWLEYESKRQTTAEVAYMIIDRVFRHKQSEEIF